MKFTQRLALGYLRIKFRLLSLVSKKAAARAALTLFCTPQHRSKKQPSGIFNEAEKLQFDLDHISVKGFRWNKGASRRALIIHGFESSIINFEQYVLPLISKGLEVLAFDAPAHGNSGGTMITAPLFARMITTIYNTYGPIHSFVSHSFGGLALTLSLEEIHHDENLRVALIAPATESITAAEQFFDLLKLKEDLRTEFDGLITEIGGHGLGWYSISRAIKNIHATVLWIHDEDDEQTPLSDALKVKHENLPNVKFIITRGLGHRRIYRDPKIIQEIVNFL